MKLYKYDLLVKVVSGIVIAGIIGLVSMNYTITTKVAVVHNDISYIKEMLAINDRRISRLELNTMTHKDADELKSWINLKIQATNINQK